MTKKLISLLFAFALLFSAACAETMDLAARPADLKPLERYAAWQEADGLWRVYSNETAAALSQMSAEAGGSVAYFYLELSGERATGLIQPELVFCYAGTRALNADAVSQYAGGKSVIRNGFPCNYIAFYRLQHSARSAADHRSGRHFNGRSFRSGRCGSSTSGPLKSPFVYRSPAR